MNGCLIGAVTLFALLLIGMLVLAVIRFSNPPEPRPGPPPTRPMGMLETSRDPWLPPLHGPRSDV